MADPNETVASKIDLTLADFRTSGCAWCHPGGGPVEYDREGYRYDGAPGLTQAGPNPTPNVADYQIFGIQAGADASSYAGAGFFEVTSTTGLFNPEQVINQGTLKSAYDPVAGTYKTVGRKFNSATAGGVAEADCLMCHYGGQYANLERNYAFPAATSPKIAASLGLVGPGTQSGLLSITTKGSWNGTAGTNPNPATTTWSWNEFIGTPGVTGNPVTLRPQDFVTAPRNENCALCHFPDRSIAAVCSTAGDPTKCGPAGKPLGFTAFQKYMPAGSTKDGDEIPGPGPDATYGTADDVDGNNNAAWAIAKGRVEGGKRGESINDNLNPDAHMKWPAYAGTGPRMKCAECHYNLEGTYTALLDGSGNVVQPTVYPGRRDHQFAKGDNAPDGKNMDQLDNTATCQGCHITRTHPNAGAAKNPATAHMGIPGTHFQKLSCKVCHIPWLNGPVDQDLADFTVGPFQTFERTQTLEAGTTGINRRPLYMWRQTEHGEGHMEIQPFGIMSVALVANATAASGGEATAVTPTYQRLGKKAAEQLRAFYGDQNGDGRYDWPLNALQNNDRTLIVNTPVEIADFFTQVGIAGGAAAPANPVLHFYFNQFSVSHNIRPRSAATNQILGSTAGGGCVMCHSSSNPAEGSYRASSVGFFDKTYSLFSQPTDGGGLIQTVLPAVAPLSGDLERVNIKFPYKRPDGSAASVNLSNSAGQAVGNVVAQGEVLGYDATKLDYLKNPNTGSFTITASATNGGTISDAGTTYVPGFTSKTYTITPNTGYRVYLVLVNGKSKGAVTSWTFTKVSSNQKIQAYFTPQ